MNLLKNAIALRYKQSIVIDSTTGKTPATHVRGLLLDISQLGYTLSGDAVRAVRGLHEVEFKTFHTMLVTNLKEMVGDNVKHRALFKNFPTDVPDDDEYFVKRFVGYVTNMFDIVEADVAPLSCGHVIDTRLFNVDEFGACPICQRQVDELDDDESHRPALEDITPLKVIDIIEADALEQIFVNLLAAKSSISEEDRTTIAMMIEDNPSLFLKVPDVIPMKEVLAVIAGLAVDYEYKGTGEDYTLPASNVLLDNIKTATDVLRLAVQLSGGDVSLAEKSRFKLKNKERRVIMFLLNDIKTPDEDMLRYKMRWVRLAEVIHAGKYAKKFPNALKAIDTIRNRAGSITTFNSKVEKLVDAVNSGKKGLEGNVLELLTSRPGEFARRIDWMLRTFTDKDIVILAFENITDNLPTKMLLTLRSYFQNRFNGNTDRYFMPKGQIAKMQIIKDDRATFSDDYALAIESLIDNALLERFSQMESLGDVYINEDLQNFLVPMVQRNASKSLVTIARGSQVPLTESAAVRMFLWWKNNDSRVDVDLSAVSYDAEWNFLNYIGFTNLSDVGGAHSGDIQDAPKGASEFIDIDIATARRNGVRFIVMSANSWTGQPFNTFECFAGVMERDSVGKGKKYEPKTVTNKFDIAGETRYNIPLILDLETKKVIWADMAVQSQAHESAFSKKATLAQQAKAVVDMGAEKPNLLQLARLHATTRATSIDTIRQEGKVYDTEFDVSMATNIDDILANWL